MKILRDREAVLAYLTVKGAAPPSVIEAAAAAGFDAATVRVAPMDADFSPHVVSEMAMVDETLTRMACHGVATAEIEFILIGPSVRLDVWRAILEAGQALGARRVSVMCVDPDEERATANFGELCELAASHGIRPSLEATAYSDVSSIEQAYRIVANAGHPAGAVAVDPLHLQRTGGTPADVARLVAVCPERFPNGHLCDARAAAPSGGRPALAAEAREDRLLPGDGELPLRDLVDALPPGVPLNVEVPVRALEGLPAIDRARRAAETVARFFVSER